MRSSVMPIVLLPGGNSYRKDILRRRQGAGRIISKGAWRIVGFVEVDNGRAIGCRFPDRQEPAGWISRLPAGLVAEDDEQVAILFQGIESILFRAERKDQFSGCLLLACLSKDISDGNLCGLSRVTGGL